MKRRLILWSLVIAFICLVVSRFTEIQKLVSTLKQGQWQWILAADFVIFTIILLISLIYLFLQHDLPSTKSLGPLLCA